MALEGIAAAKEAYDFDVSDVLPSGTSDYRNVIRDAAETDTALIVGIGFTYVDAIAHVAPDYPATSFLLIDGDAGDLTNVRSVTFRPEEGSFLVGAVAAIKSRSRSVGFVGAMDIPILRRFQCGYEAGVALAAKRRGLSVTVSTRYIGTTPEAFSAPAKGRDLALRMYESGIDVIFHAAGKSGNGVIQAAEDVGKWAIGVDADQSHLAPNAVITSMRKRIDLVVADAIQDVMTGEFSGSQQSLGISEGRLDWVVDPVGGVSHISTKLETEIDGLRSEIDKGVVAHCAP